MEHEDNSATHHSISGYILPETLFRNTEAVAFSTTHNLQLKMEYQTTAKKVMNYK
jgi:hypothetical protein